MCASLRFRCLQGERLIVIPTAGPVDNRIRGVYFRRVGVNVAPASMARFVALLIFLITEIILPKN